MLVQVLGPLRARTAGGEDVTPAGALQRRLLALLVLQRGRVVPAHAAVEALWPDRPPQDPTGALQNHLSRLRRSMPAGAIESVGDGYRLAPGAVLVDCERLTELIAAAPTAEVVEELAALLEGWRGPAFVELDDVEQAGIEASRLEELRLRGLERIAEHRLDTGATDGLVADLVALSDEEPLREGPRSLLMRALAATGRHAEALRAFDDFRRLLGDELGIDPSPALAALHDELLRGHERAGPVELPRRPGPGPLPIPATPLVGREQLEVDAGAVISASRLVSLLGPGGVGKTRLLVELGHRLQREDPSRPVALCELAAAGSDSVTRTVAGSLGVDLRPGTDPVDQVAGVIAGTDLVLLVDNCEHVLAPVADLAERLLGRCPSLRIVATSRERLRVPGEHVVAVPTLAMDGDDPPAVRLFLDRARAVDPAFDPDADAMAAVRELVRRLDGLPLAIELAAARLLTHGVEEVVTALDRRFALLTAGPRTSARHASLLAAVSWSFDLLDPRLQQVLSSVSVFAGSFTADDAAAVCDLDVHVTADALADLAERSLVLRAPGRRWVLLETLRAFGAEVLHGSGRRDAVAERHARHLVAWARGAHARMLTPGSGAIAEIEASVPELQQALTWLLDHDQTVLAGTLVRSLLDYGIFRLRSDVLAWADRVTACDPDDRSPVASEVWVVAAYSAWMAGDVDEIGVRAGRALAIAQRDGDEVPARVCSIMGNHALFEGRLDDAAHWYRRASETAERRGDRAQWRFMAPTEVLALGYAGDPRAVEVADELLARCGDEETPYDAYLWYCLGESDLERDPARAQERFARAIELAERTDASFVTGVAGASRASLEVRLGDPHVAAREYRHLIDHWRRAGMWSTQWTMLRSIAVLLVRLERHRDAAVLVGAVRAPGAGHRIFGADEAVLGELDVQLRDSLGDADYERALAEGALLDGEAAVEHVLRAL